MSTPLLVALRFEGSDDACCSVSFRRKDDVEPPSILAPPTGHISALLNVWAGSALDPIDRAQGLDGFLKLDAMIVEHVMPRALRGDDSLRRQAQCTPRRRP